MTEKSRISNALSAEYNELLQEKEDGVAESRREPTAWEALKGGGANHYHTPGGVQPIDLFVVHSRGIACTTVLVSQ